MNTKKQANKIETLVLDPINKTLIKQQHIYIYIYIEREREKRCRYAYRTTDSKITI